MCVDIPKAMHMSETAKQKKPISPRTHPSSPCSGPLATYLHSARKKLLGEVFRGDGAVVDRVAHVKAEVPVRRKEAK